MKKPYAHTELSNVECAHTKCAWVNRREGVARRMIKMNVVHRCGTNAPINCYPCSVYLKTGQRIKKNTALKTMAAGK